MIARSGSYHVDPKYFDEALAFFDTDFAKNYHSSGGNVGGLLLGDRRTGKLVGISFWQSESAMEASEGDAERLRQAVQSAGHGSDPIVREDFEILAMRLPGQRDQQTSQRDELGSQPRYIEDYIAEKLRERKQSGQR